MKRGSSLSKRISILLIFLVLFALVSCNRSYDEAEVIENASRLLKQAEILNEVYYGKGIQYINTGFADGYYFEADPMHLNKLGFSTIAELKNKTLETFTEGYSEQIFSTKLSVIEDETGIQAMTRYYQKYDGVSALDPVCIMVYSNAAVMLKDDIVYDYSTLRVSGVKKQTVYVNVDATVTNSEGKSQKVTIRLDLIEEDFGWRIDNPCYANYNDKLDIYNDLNK